MKVEPKRVKKVDSPLLIIGLGGTGTDALLTIMDKFNRRYELPKTPNGEILDTPERTAYLALDTDAMELKSKQRGNMSFTPGNILTLSIPSRLGLKALPEYMTSWLDKNLTGFEIKHGAGGNRQVGRYVLFHNVDAVYTKIKTVIHNLLATPAGGIMGTLEIVLTTGISGGTGAGTFMDMAYLVRHVMRTAFPTVNYNFMAYIMMPPVNVDKIPNITPGKQDMLESTGFAALKELDFWMNYDTHHYHYVQRYSPNIEIEWDSKPFDNAVLMGNATAQGDIIVNAYENCMDVLSESVVNFFAHESGDAGGQISLRSHLSNIQMQQPYLLKEFPANYTYMTVGAAVSNSQQEEMVTYESKLVFDRIGDLQKTDKVSTQGSRHAAPMLGKREGEEFLEKFLPPTTNYFDDFANIKPNLDIFMWTPADVANSQPFHDVYYSEWRRDCELEAEKFAVEQVKQLRNRFRDMVMTYATDLTYGPFVLSEFLRDPEQGFTGFFNNLTENWENQKHNIQIERNSLFSEVSADLYPAMMNIPKIAKLAGLWGPAERYRKRCEDLFVLEREYQLAHAMAAELKGLRQEIKDYAEIVLPEFCNQLLQVRENTSSTMKTTELEASVNNIAPTQRLKEYIDKAFGSPEQDKLAIRVIGQMITQSLDVKLNNTGTVEGVQEVRETFVKAANQFVLEASTLLNGMSMDQLVDIKMPDESRQEKVNYVAQTVLPELKRAARTMLPLSNPDEASNNFVNYAYVSIPNNANLIQEGVKEYQATEQITPKVSDVSDMIFWLNTYNCIAMYMYTDLARLEKVYDRAMATNGVGALHLVQTTTETGEHILRHDWSLLPSPVVHRLQKLATPAVVAARQAEIGDMLDQALANGAAELTVAANGQEKLILRLRMEGDSVESMDQFDRKLNAILDNKELSPEAKIERLNALASEGKTKPIEYKSYVEEFAAAEGMRLTATAPTDAEKQLVAENREKARRMVAKYILYAWYPQIAEQMITQKEMFGKLTQAIAAQKALLEDSAKLHAFVKQFLLLYFNDTFVVRRLSVNYKNHRGEEDELISKADLTDDEATIYAEFSPALVLLSVLGSENDERVDARKRSYLREQAAELEKRTNRMSDDEFAELQQKARAFCKENEAKAEDIRWYKGELSQPVREQMIGLIDKLCKAAKRLSM